MSEKSRTRSLAQINHKLLAHSSVIQERIAHRVSAGGPVEVLEVGFGWGRALMELAWLFRSDPVKFHGVDLARKPPVESSDDLRAIGQRFGIGSAAQLDAFAVPRLHFYDATKLHFADESIDLVYSAVSVRFFERKAEFIEEVGRVLRPGGTALLHIGEKHWDYAHARARDDMALTGSPTRLVLLCGRDLVPLPEYFACFEGDAFRFRFTPQSRCVLFIEKLRSAKLELRLAFNEYFSSPMAQLPYRDATGEQEDGFRSVYDVAPEIYRHMRDSGRLAMRPQAVA